MAMKWIAFPMLLVITFSHAQELSCGTTIDQTNIERLQASNERWTNRVEQKDYDGATRYVPVQLHIIRSTGGAGGISEVDCIAAFDRMNDYYIDASVHFFQCAPINFIDDNNYYTYDKSQMDDLQMDHGVIDVVNIYVAQSVTSSGNAICGHAQFPGGLDFVMQSVSCMKNGSTLIHEMGHYMGLYHTHETSFGDESVNGSDCLSDGDLLCDTPADPRLSGSTNFNNDGCIYYGSDTDENGQSYSPMVSNIMSYASKECRFELTEDQTDRILWTLENERGYLSCASQDLDAYFYARAVDPSHTCWNARQMAFYNVSEGESVTYSWDFGDGSPVVTGASPNHTFNSNGVYTVTLTVSDGVSSQNFSRKVNVGAVSLPYTNDFENGPDDLDRFEAVFSMKNTASVRSDAAESGSYGLCFEGTATSSESPTFQTPVPPETFDQLWNPHFKAELFLCVDAVDYENLTLEFDKKQLRRSNDNYTNFRITVDGDSIGEVYQVNSPFTDDPNFTHVVVDLSAYDGNLVRIGFEGCHAFAKDYTGTDNGCATLIDNIYIHGDFNFATVGLNETETTSFSLSPNPVQNVLRIDGSIDTESMICSDLSGKNVKHLITVLSETNGSIQLDVSRLSSGVYLIGSGNSLQRFVKN